LCEYLSALERAAFHAGDAQAAAAEAVNVWLRLSSRWNETVGYSIAGRFEGRNTAVTCSADPPVNLSPRPKTRQAMSEPMASLGILSHAWRQPSRPAFSATTHKRATDA
jgi:hypothetical protein